MGYYWNSLYYNINVYGKRRKKNILKVIDCKVVKFYNIKINWNVKVYIFGVDVYLYLFFSY